jgi:hypothetical protein
MRFQIQTEDDLRLLQGKFIVQVSNDKPNITLDEYKWGFLKEKRLFLKEKRLFLVAGYSLVDLHGGISNYENFEKFQNYFNHYLFDHMIKAGETDGGRHHRLLTSKEHDYLCTKMKEENY